MHGSNNSGVYAERARRAAAGLPPYTNRHTAQSVKLLDLNRNGPTISFAYTNWKGERSVRNVAFIDLSFGSTPDHKNPQWLLRAYDRDKCAERTFALADMRPLEVFGIPITVEQPVGLEPADPKEDGNDGNPIVDAAMAPGAKTFRSPSSMKET